MESQKDPDLAPLIFPGHRGKRGGRGDRQRGMRNKVRVEALEAHPCGHEFDVMVGLSKRKQDTESISHGVDNGKRMYWAVRQCSHIWEGSWWIPRCGCRGASDGTYSCLEPEAAERRLEPSMREERVREEETKEDDATEDTVTEDSLLYVKSLPPTVAVLHRSISLYVMPDLLPGLRGGYGTSAPSNLDGDMGVVRVGVMLLCVVIVVVVVCFVRRDGLDLLLSLPSLLIRGGSGDLRRCARVRRAWASRARAREDEVLNRSRLRRVLMSDSLV